MGRKSKDRVPVAFKLPRDIVAKIDALALAQEKTKTEIIVRAVRNLWRSFERNQGARGE